MKIGFVIPLSFALACLGGGYVVADEYAPTSLSTDQIIAKMVAATGEMQGGQYLISERAQNGDGTTTNVTTEISGADFLTLLQTGTVTAESGRYEGQYWERDANGTVLVERSGGLGGSSGDVQWLKDESGRVPVHVLGITSAAPREYALTFRMKDGTDVTAYVDVATNLLSRIEYAFSGGGHSTTAYSDYREMFGAKTAFEESDTEQGFPQNGSETKILSWTESPTSDDALAMPQSQPLFSVDSTTVLPARFTYEPDEDYNGDADDILGPIVVTANVNGQSIDLALDSGSYSLVLDPGAARRLGLTVYGRRRASIGGPIDESSTVIPEMNLGGLTVRNATFDVLPFGENVQGANIVGLLGCDFFASAIVGLDFKKQTVTLYPRSTFDPTSMSLVAVPLRTNDCTAHVAAMFDGVPGTFTLDTGADATMVDRAYLQKLPHAVLERDTESLPEGSDYAGFIGGAVATNDYAVDDFIFAGTRFRKGDVIVPNNFSLEDTFGVDGIIGRNVLRMFTVYLDYADGVAFFKLNR
jgi:hypothetical protein